jgi:TolB-like protein
VLYEMSRAARPFQGRTGFELSAAILNHVPELASIAPPLQTVILRCLEKDAAQRYKNGSEVRAALEMIRTGGAVPLAPSTARPAAVVDTTSRTPAARPSRRRAIWAGAGLLTATALAIATWQLWPTTVRSLAVLPFENRTNDEDLGYLCEGISESLIRQTATLPALRVSNFSTVLNFNGRSVDAAAAGRQLGVESVLAGTLERQGPRLLISARLIDVATGRQLWTNAYDRDAADLLDVQDEIATAIMNDGLRLRLSSEQRQQLVRHPTTDGDAYDLYLQARFVQRRATEEDYLYSRELLQRAIVRDPKFALAYAALSGNYAMMVTDGLERPTDAWPQVNKHARQALALDSTLPEALAMEHAVAFLFDWDWAGAERARRRFLESPVGDFDPQVLRAMSTELWALGRPDQALQLARRTRELDPRSPYLAILEADYLLRTDQFDAATALYRHAVSLEPDNLNAYFGLAEALYRQKRFDEAIAARQKAHELAADDALKEVLASARGEQGYRAIDEAWVRLQIDALKARAATAYVSPLDLARAYAQLGDTELAFRHLEASFVDRSPGLVFLKVDRAWDVVRDDPRFTSAVQRVGLP